jgi:hypothetical protein
VNTDAKIKEKQTLSDLALDFYAKRGLPDDRFFWTAARSTVQKILKDAKGKQPPATLFLRLHYPFFDDKVQKVLMQRHPEPGQINSGFAPWYAVEAYLIAEQFGLVAYGNGSPKTFELLGDSAQFYSFCDLRWFSQLMVAVTGVFERMQMVSGLGADPIALKLQEWNNHFSQSDESPCRWLDGSEFLERLKKYKKSPLNSVRVSAATENRKREDIFQSWLPCWQAELQRLNERLAPNPDMQKKTAHWLALQKLLPPPKK